MRCASATAIEMLHNAFLVHDDIEDESDLRRGVPTMHAEHGVPIAVNAGDMLTALSIRILATTCRPWVFRSPGGCTTSSST